jgi:hypothetical protein
MNTSTYNVIKTRDRIATSSPQHNMFDFNCSVHQKFLCLGHLFAIYILLVLSKEQRTPAMQYINPGF